MGSRQVLIDQADAGIARKTTASGWGTSDFIFVEFNAWLYQGYDDARAALMEVIAATLETEAEKRKKGVQKAKDLLKARLTGSGRRSSRWVRP